MRKLGIPGSIISAAAILTFAIQAQGQQGRLQAAARALGSDSLRTLTFSGTGANFAFAQAYSAGAPWPRFNLKSYTAEIDYQIPAMRVEWERTLPPQTPPPGVSPSPLIWRGGGGAPPFLLPQRPDLIAVHMVQVVSGNAQWNVLGPATTPVFVPISARLLDIWMTPHGVLKAAIEAGSQAVIKTSNAGKTVITFPVAGTTVTTTLNSENLVERVETPEDNAVLGDISIETIYSDYRDFNGTKFPMHILRKEGDFPILELTVTDVHPNANVKIEVPQNIAQASAQAPQPPPALQVEAKKIGDGVYRMEGPGVFYHSVAVEFKDYIVVIEGPVGDDLALPIIDAVKKAIPNKPIKYVVNTHVNFDHSGGLRAFVAEGSTVITHTSNKAYYENVWARPHTIHPDRLAQFPKKAAIETIADKRVITDGDQRLELYHLTSIWHNNGMVVAYIPKMKLLVVADLFEGLPKEAAPPNPDFQNLFNEIQRLKLDVVQISPLHVSMQTMEGLRKAIGKSSGD